jgi:glycosyltransferase involved in cell wall biosynthesis
MFNEEKNIPEFHKRLLQALENLEENWEIIFINDGSSDRTLFQLIALHHQDSRLKIISFSRNFGKEIALTAGIEKASGQLIIPIDADLQDPPELIPEMIEKWREGYQIVNATRRARHGESWLKRITAEFFYFFINKMSTIPIPKNTGDFRLLSRPVVEALRMMPERTRFMKGLFAWVGFQQATVYYDRPPRHAGKTKWNYWRLWNFAIDGLSSFSSIPLRIWSYCGLLLSLLAFLYAGFLVVKTVIFGKDWPGYASTMVAILFLGGIQLISLGVIGEYLGRVYKEVKMRPLYIVERSYGFDQC